ncbi:MAG: hypothetical protein WBC92_05250 [Terracidiphilus sp.]
MLQWIVPGRAIAGWPDAGGLIGILREYGAHAVRRDIFSVNIPISGTQVSRDAVVFSSQSRLSQRIFFPSAGKAVLPQFFLRILRFQVVAQWPQADILRFRASPPFHLITTEERFLYITYVTAGTRGA